MVKEHVHHVRLKQVFDDDDAVFSGLGDGHAGIVESGETFDFLGDRVCLLNRMTDLIIVSGF